MYYIPYYNSIMTTISIRLTKDDERDLKAIQRATGCSLSEAVRRAIRTEREALAREEGRGMTLGAHLAALLEARQDDPVGPPTDDARHVSKRVRAILKAKHQRRQ